MKRDLFHIRVSKLIFAFLFVLYLCPLSWSQSTTSVPAGQIYNNLPNSKAYGANEFPQWVYYLRRFEIVLFGSFPIVYLVSNFSYDYIYFLLSGMPSNYRPAPFGSGTSTFSQSQNNNKYTQIIISSFIISTVIACIDLAINLANHKNDSIDYQP